MELSHPSSDYYPKFETQPNSQHSSTSPPDSPHENEKLRRNRFGSDTNLPESEDEEQWGSNNHFQQFPSMSPSRNISTSLSTPKSGDAQRWISADPSNGYIRVYSPVSPADSKIFPCSTNAPAKNITEQLGIPSDGLFVHYCGDRLKRLQSTDCPLQMQNDFLNNIGFTQNRRIQKMGTSIELGYLIRFFAGIPLHENIFSPGSKKSYLLVKRAKTLSRWKIRLCILSGTRLLLYKGSNRSSVPTDIILAKGELSIDKTREFCLRIVSKLQENKTYLLTMKTARDFEKWHKKLKNATDRVTDCADLSHSNLELVPKPLFTHIDLKSLNARHNVLRTRPPELAAPGLGYIDDLTQFTSLSVLNLSDNRLESFPECVCDLRTLIDLNLSSNKIKEVSPNIQQMVKLEFLHLHSNLLRDLPEELNSLSSLTYLGISFNLFDVIPDVVCDMTGGSTLSLHLSGNRIESLEEKLPRLKSIRRLDLRLNRLTLPTKETEAFQMFTSLTHLEIKDNSIPYLDLLSVPSLVHINCSRNHIRELKLNGTSLQKVNGAQNLIETLVIEPKPDLLEYLNVSSNRLTELPDFIGTCYLLKTVLASNNQLYLLPRNIFSEPSSKLKILRADHNVINQFPSEINHVSLEELDLHSNHLLEIDENFLDVAYRLRILNLSGNRLTKLPQLKTSEDRHRVQELFLSFNRLRDESLRVVTSYKRLRVLHISHNKITCLPTIFVKEFEMLEELNISGNFIKVIPESLVTLPRLRILRAHTNKLTDIPDGLSSSGIRILDLAYNTLFGLCFAKLENTNLEMIDVAGNTHLNISMQHLGEIKGKRRLCLVDMSGENREVPGTVPLSFISQQNLTVEAGLAETAGNRNKLYISVVRKIHFPKPDSAMFAMFDGGYNKQVPRILQSICPQVFLNEFRRSRTDADAVKYTLLTLHKSLRGLGQRLGASCGIVYLKQTFSNHSDEERSQWQMMAGNLGDVGIVVATGGEVDVVSRNFRVSEDAAERDRVRDCGGIITDDDKINATSRCSRLLGSSYLFPFVLPTPHICSANVDASSLIILASHRFWDFVTPEEAVQEIQNTRTAISATKRLMDLAQSYGSEENVSILVIMCDQMFHSAANCKEEEEEDFQDSESLSESDVDEAPPHYNYYRDMDGDRGSSYEHTEAHQTLDQNQSSPDSKHEKTRYKKRQHAANVMDVQMRERLASEVKEKELSNDFRSTPSSSNSQVDPSENWITTSKNRALPESYQPTGHLRGGFAPKSLLEDTTSENNHRKTSDTASFDSQCEINDRYGDAAENPPSESDSDQEDNVIEAISKSQHSKKRGSLAYEFVHADSGRNSEVSTPAIERRNLVHEEQTRLPDTEQESSFIGNDDPFKSGTKWPLSSHLQQQKTDTYSFEEEGQAEVLGADRESSFIGRDDPSISVTKWPLSSHLQQQETESHSFVQEGQARVLGAGQESSFIGSDDPSMSGTAWSIGSNHHPKPLDMNFIHTTEQFASNSSDLNASDLKAISKSRRPNKRGSLAYEYVHVESGRNSVVTPLLRHSAPVSEIEVDSSVIGHIPSGHGNESGRNADTGWSIASQQGAQRNFDTTETFTSVNSDLDDSVLKAISKSQKPHKRGSLAYEYVHVESGRNSVVTPLLRTSLSVDGNDSISSQIGKHSSVIASETGSKPDSTWSNGGQPTLEGNQVYKEEQFSSKSSDLNASDLKAISKSRRPSKKGSLAYEYVHVESGRNSVVTPLLRNPSSTFENNSNPYQTGQTPQCLKNEASSNAGTIQSEDTHNLGPFTFEQQNFPQVQKYPTMRGFSGDPISDSDSSIDNDQDAYNYVPSSGRTPVSKELLTPVLLQRKRTAPEPPEKDNDEDHIYSQSLKPRNAERSSHLPWTYLDVDCVTHL